MPTARLKTGEIVNVPDGLDKAGVQQYLLENGASYEQVGLPPPAKAPEQGSSQAAYNSPWAALGEASQPVSRDIGSGIREYLSQRIPAMDPYQAPDTFGAGLGRAAIPTAVSLAVPGAGWGGVVQQGLAGAGLEALRTDATGKEIAASGLINAGGAALGNMASRILTGAKAMLQSARTPTYLPTTSETARTLGSTLGGRSVVDNLNRKALASSAAASFGQKADELGPEVFRDGAEALSKEFKRIIPPATVIDVTQPLTLMQGVKNTGLRIQSLLPANPAATTAQQFQDLRRAMAQRISAAQGVDGTLADDLRIVLAQMDDAAEAAVGPTFRPDFRRVRELWKNLETIQEMATIKGGTEGITPRALSQKLSQSYGDTFQRDLGGVLPETQQLFDVARVAAKDALGQVANSGTPTRQAVVGGAAGLTGLLTGATTPEAALLAAGGVAASQAAGVASVGREVAGAGGAGAATASGLVSELERKRKAAK
jgi:hypothetical protein